MLYKIFFLLFSLILNIINGKNLYIPNKHYSVDGILEIDLNIKKQYSLNNTRFSPLYNNNIVGPTLSLKPGDKLIIHLNNLLETSSISDKNKLNSIMNSSANLIETTKLYNRLNSNGEYSNNNWGRNFMNLHLHGIQVNPLQIDSRRVFDGGVNHTYEIDIHNNHPSAFGWYHNHHHGTATYSMLSGLYGLIEIINHSDNINLNSKIRNAKNIDLILAESRTDNNSPVDSIPIIFDYSWDALTNGKINPLININKNDLILFRIASASVEPDYTISIPNHKLMIVAKDGHSIQHNYILTDKLTIIPGSRVEFLVKFNEIGVFQMKTDPWNLGISGFAGPPGCQNIDPPCPSICSIVFALDNNVDKCLSYDKTSHILQINVTNNISFHNFSFPKQIIPINNYLKKLQETLHVRKRNITLDMLESGNFQIPHNTSIQRTTQLGINGKIATPPIFEESFSGTIIKNTCELWNIKVRGIAVPHPFHVHSIPFLIKKFGKNNLNYSEWRDTIIINPDTDISEGGATIHICFPDYLNEYILVHCHMPSHQDLGMATFYKILENNIDDNIDSIDSIDESVISNCNKIYYNLSITLFIIIIFLYYII